jgi:hypothetical protein
VGVSYFPSNQFDPATDYGRSTFDVHHRFLSGGNYQGLFGVSISPFVVLDSGTPFNITTGQDLNGDNQFNDRPAFATDRSPNIVKTKCGSFTLLPSAFERIPYNLGNGPRQFSTFEDQQVVRARTRIERRGGNGMLGDRRVVVARGVDRQGVWEAASGPAA